MDVAKRKMLAMRISQGFGQRLMNAPRGPCDSFGANPLDDVDRRQKDRLSAKTLDQSRGQRDAFVGLSGNILQALHRWLVVLCRERLKSEDRLQFGQVFPPRLCPLSIAEPCSSANLSCEASIFNTGGNGSSSALRIMPG